MLKKNKTKKPVLSIIIPVYNEKKTIEKLVNKVDQIEIDKQIIIIDDGSTDGSTELIKKIRINSPSIKLFHKYNQGKGTSIRTGLQKATGEFTVIQDADLEYTPFDLEVLIQPLLSKRTNVVYGSRFKLAKKGVYSSFTFFVGGQIVNWLANLLYGIHITDEPTCYKLVKTKLLKSLNLQCSGFEFCPEVTAKLALKHEKILELPISYTPRHFEQGKKINWKDGLIAVLTLVKYRFQKQEFTTKHMIFGLESLSNAANYNKWILDQFRNDLKGHILEVGSGLGTFTKILLPFSSNITALEIDPTYYKIFLKRFKDNPKIDFRTTDISSTAANSTNFKKVNTTIMVNVLEHIENHEQVVKNISKILLPKGKLIIFVPAMPQLYSAWDASVGHYRRYTKSDLFELCKKNNLKVRKLYYFNFVGAFGWYLNKLVGTTPRSQQFGGQVVLYDRVFVPVVSKLEKYIKPPFGQSLVLVAEK
jgi:dolichol-phosphate mannosyltransferase